MSLQTNYEQNDANEVCFWARELVNQ
jgi:hypothetical protein